MFNINEFFYSIQGEGANTGMPALFVRLAGCNLACQWCDTKYHTTINETLSSADLMHAVKHYGCKNIVFTGGEPLLQLAAIHSFAEDFKKSEALFIAIETNGTIGLQPRDEFIFDWITVSPKNNEVPLIIKQGYMSEIKLVYTGKENLEQFENLVLDETLLYLQACAGQEGSQELTIEKVKEKKGIWNLSIQTHKLLNIQ